MTSQLANDYNPALRLLALPLAAMGWAGPVYTVRSSSLPTSSIGFFNCHLILGVTPSDPPMFADSAAAALEHERDVMLIRAGLAPEIDNAVSLDLAMRTPAELVTFSRYHFCERENGSLWLCPDGDTGPVMELSSRGLHLHLNRPFCNDERSDAACRAAARIVRLVRGKV